MKKGEFDGVLLCVQSFNSHVDDDASNLYFHFFYGSKLIEPSNLNRSYDLSLLGSVGGWADCFWQRIRLSQCWQTVGAVRGVSSLDVSSESSIEVQQIRSLKPND